MKRRTPLAVFLLVSALAAVPIVDAPVAHAAQTGGGTTFRASVSSSGEQALNPSTRARISQDGRHVVYQTKARLVSNDLNNMQDIYWTDLTNPFAPVTRRVTTTPSGGDPNNDSEFAEISGDGRYVIFATLATNILPGGQLGVFLRDMIEPDPQKATRLVAPGMTRPVISDNARFVAYNTLGGAESDTFVKDLSNNRVLQLTSSAADPDAESFRPEISGDGTHVVFASDLQLTPNDQNSARDVYEADISSWTAGGGGFTLRLVSVGTNGLAVGSSSSRPGINRDGSVVSFQSFAGNLVGGDTNGTSDAFVRDYRTNPGGTTYVVSYRTDGTIPPTAESSRPQLDDSGDIVTFVSTGGNIVNGDTNDREDSFIRNWKQERATGQWGKLTFLLGISPTGAPGLCPGIANVDEGTKDISTRPYLSGDGKVVVFISGQCNLTPPTAFGGPDTNLYADVFVRTFRSVGPPPPPPNGYRPLPTPVRLLDTRPGAATVDGQMAGIGARPAMSVLELPVSGRAGVPANAASVVMNLTVTEPATAGYATVFPCGHAPPLASSLNFSRLQTIPNAVITKVGAGGKVCLLASATTHLVADLSGSFPASGYTPLAAPARLLDSRPGQATIDGRFAGIGQRPAGSVLELTVAGRAGVPSGAASVVLNVAAVDAAGAGFVTAYPCGQARPLASSLNFAPGQTVANAVVAKVGVAGNVCLFNSAPTQLLADVGGSFPNAVVYAALPTPARLLDTRPGQATVDGQFAGIGIRPASSVLALQVAGRAGVPATARSVVLNVTAVDAAGAGFATVYPCGESPPLSSNLNYVAGQTIANAVLAKVGLSGQVCFLTSAATHLVVDVAGTLA